MHLLVKASSVRHFLNKKTNKKTQFRKDKNSRLHEHVKPAVSVLYRHSTSFLGFFLFFFIYDTGTEDWDVPKLSFFLFFFFSMSVRNCSLNKQNVRIFHKP